MSVGHAQASAPPASCEHAKCCIGEGRTIKGMLIHLIDSEHVESSTLLLQMAWKMLAQGCKALGADAATKWDEHSEALLTAAISARTTQMRLRAASSRRRSLAATEMVMLIPAARARRVDVFEARERGSRVRCMHEDGRRRALAPAAAAGAAPHVLRSLRKARQHSSLRNAYATRAIIQ